MSGRRINDAACVVTLCALLALVGWCWCQPDPVQQAQGSTALAALVDELGERQRQCAHSALRAAYAQGEPAPEQVDAAYAQCAPAGSQ